MSGPGIFHTLAGARICLASTSPRRREMLKRLGIDFFCLSPGYEETPASGDMKPEDYAMLMARRKLESVLPALSQPVAVISADTVVCARGQILGKPVDAQDALRMLKILNGSEHTVISAGVLAFPGKEPYAFHDRTHLTFGHWPQAVLEAYVAAGEPFGKAGAYAIQERGCLFVEKMSGPLCNVIGLPLGRIVTALLAAGFIASGQ